MDDDYKTRQTLIQRLKENHDEQSWEDFLRIYRPYIRAIIRNMNISENDADDMVQQVMLKVWNKIGEKDEDPTKRFRSWLSAVTSNCVKNYIRKRVLDTERLEKARQDKTRSYLNAIRLPDLDRIAEREWRVHIFNLAMERIDGLFSGKAIQVFRLSIEGMSVEQIASKMELKENSVYRLKNRVKERLAEEIELLREELE
ncbi:RNA polymerase sigma factor [Pontiella sulfatireligans]|uniref:RNA polymerase sigma factor SigS n=1 Tax=Pontiella sulfatireligans TaxID=2750658 RepID=A0A6C2UG66_9BACT|nr:sigma-70 family RNA polymerase sigma factor [Pontiella sulfatireligans]VGO18517.1 hypothetical protein SCARR_00570 [Pontiella sulfatireligans]